MTFTLLSTWWSSCCGRWVLTDAGHLLGVVPVGPLFTAQVIVNTGPTSGGPKCRVQTQNLGVRNRCCR